jgi:hypothetical protein
MAHHVLPPGADPFFLEVQDDYRAAVGALATIDGVTAGPPSTPNQPPAGEVYAVGPGNSTWMVPSGSVVMPRALVS